MSSLRRKTVSGVLWSGAAKLILQLVLLAVMSVLARLLSKDDFGIVGMAAVITVAVNMVNDRGLGTAIVQRKSVTAGQLSSMFWGSLVFGVLLYAVSAVAAYPLAHFFRKEIVAPVVLVMALGFVVGSFCIVQKALLTREMDFKRLSLIEIVSVLLSGAVAIVLAFLGFGVWSLAANSLLRDVFNVAGLWLCCRWRPFKHFSWKEFRESLGFSSRVLANDGAVYLIMNVDVTIIGRVLGSAALGVYNMALYLVKMPITRISAIVAKVVFPALALVQDDRRRFGSAYCRAMKFISLLTFPALVLLAVFSRELIGVVLGEKWLEMATPLIVLTPMAMLKSVGTLRNAVLTAVGKPQVELYWNLLYVPPLAVVVYWGTRYGVNGVAAAFTAIYLLTFPVIQHLTNRQAGITMFDFAASIAATTVASLAAGTFGFLLRFLIGGRSTPLVVAALGIPAAFAVYIAVLWLIDRSVFEDIREMIREFSRRNERTAIVEGVTIE